MKRSVILFAVLALLLTGCIGGEYTLVGQVLIDSTKEPLSDVEIVIDSVGTTKTDKDGKFQMAGLKGNVKVTPVLEGWEFYPNSITVKGKKANAEFLAINLEESGYTLLDWEPVANAYWHSNNTTGKHYELITSANNSKNFVSSGRTFTKEDIPVGSVIEIAEGYSYRPDGWITKDTVNASKDRPANVSGDKTPRVEVTEEWWGDWTIRGFNVSTNPAGDVAGKVDEISSALKIYVPRN